MVDKVRFGSREKLFAEDGGFILTKLRALLLVTGSYLLAAVVSRCLVHTVSIAGDERISVVTGSFGCLFLFLWLRALVHHSGGKSLRERQLQIRSTLFALGCSGAITGFWLFELAFDVFPANPPTVGVVAVVWSILGGILVSRNSVLRNRVRF